MSDDQAARQDLRDRIGSLVNGMEEMNAGLRETRTDIASALQVIHSYTAALERQLSDLERFKTQLQLQLSDFDAMSKELETVRNELAPIITYATETQEMLVHRSRN